MSEAFRKIINIMGLFFTDKEIFAFVSSWYNLKITLFILRHNYLFIDCLFRGAILFMSLLFKSS